MSHTLGYRIKHHIQRGISADNYLIGGKSENIPEKLLELKQAVKSAVISAVDTAYIFKACVIPDKVKHFFAQIHIIKARFSAGHIQGEVESAQAFVFGSYLVKFTV